MSMSKSVPNIVMVLFCAAAVLLMRHAGISARSDGASSALSSDRLTVVVVERTTDLVRLWQERRVQGRTLVHMGRFLHFVDNTEEPGMLKDTRAILHAGNLSHLRTSPVTYRNFLRVAFEQNMIRQKYHVFSPQDFRERFSLQISKGSSRVIDDHEYGSRSFYTEHLPPINEAVLLNVDASYFHAADVDSFLEMVGTSPLKVDVVTFCLAVDSPDVSEDERSRLRQALARLGPRADVTHFGSAASAGVSQ